MSVFRQLMMKRFHSEANYMPLTVVGSPTISSGVVSNFSTSNYLEKATSISLSTQKLEVVLDITMTSISSEGLCLFATNTLSVQLYSQSTTYKKINLGGSQITGTKEYLLNTNYKIKLKFYVVGSSIHLDIYYLEGSSWILDASYTNLPYTTISKFILGDNYTHSGTRVFTGSYNLNNSYIKINSIKYDFQFALPLTVAGSPTITDGVVSGFSTSNYLQYPFFDNIGTRDFELSTAFILNTSTTATRIIATYGSDPTFTGISINASSGITFVVYDGAVQTNTPRYTIQAGTKYYVKVYRKGTEIGIKISTNNVDWETYTNTISENANLVSSSNLLQFGVNRYGGSYIDGSIDLNYTYMILDGTKYIFTV